MAKNKRFTDTIPIEVIEEPENHLAWMIGYEAAKTGKIRSESQTLYWKFGYDQFLAEQLEETIK